MASNALTTIDSVVTLHLTLDRSKPLAPQVVCLREVGLPWKLIEEMAGKTRQGLDQEIRRWADGLGQGRLIG